MSQALTIAPSRAIATIHPRDDIRPSFERGVREFQTEAEMKAASLEVRRRLSTARPIPPKPTLRQWSFSPAPLPVLPSGELVPESEEQMFGPDIPTKDQLVQSIIDVHGISIREIRSSSRMKSHVAARHDLIRMLHTFCAMPAAQIGRVINKDHTSVLYVINGNHRRVKK